MTEWEELSDHLCPIDEHCSKCVDEAWYIGAAVAFGLMGMAEAIGEREARKPLPFRALTPWSYDDDPYEDRGHGNG